MQEPSFKDEMAGNLELLTVEDLEDLIRQEMSEEENIDLDFLKKLTEAVNHKQQYPTIDAYQSLKIFKETYQCENEGFDSKNNTIQPVARKRRMSIRILLVAALVIILLCAIVIAQAAGINIFNIFGFWSEKQLYYGGQYVPETYQQIVELPELPKEQNFTSLQEVFSTLNIQDKLLPSWQPSGYKLDELYVSDMIPGRLRFEAFYQAEDWEDNHYSVGIVLYSDSTSVGSGFFEKDDEPVELYTINDHTVYVFSNLGETIVTWMDGHYMICISGNIDKQVLIHMAESIY